MPKEIFNRDYEFLPREQLLSFEEMAETAAVFARFGVNKIRLTGGEPLMRKGIETLISSVKAIDGIDDVTLTTNGSLLKRDAAKLVEAGLDRVTVSLDSLNDETFMAMNDAGYTVAQVLEGIEAASHSWSGAHQDQRRGAEAASTTTRLSRWPNTSGAPAT